MGVLKMRTDSGEFVPVGGGGSGLTVAQVNALDGMFKIASYTEDPTSAYAAFKAAFGIGDSGGGEEEPDEPVTPEVTLTSISATYSGGDVDAGTALTDLTGIVVTAHYSDGSTATVTDYTLSGEIAEGENAITVSYGGKTTTFTVTGVAVVEPLYGVFWPPKGSVTDWNNHDWAGVENFAYTANSGQYIDAGFLDSSFVRLDKLQGTVYIRTLTREQYGLMEQGCYQVYANSDGEISTGGFTKIAHTVYRQFGGKTETMDVNGTTYYFMMFKFEIPAGQTGYFVSTAGAMHNDYFVSADKIAIDEDYQQYYTLFTSDPSDKITEGAVEVS